MQRKPQEMEFQSQVVAPVEQRIDTMVLADMLTLAYVLKQMYQQSSRQDVMRKAATGLGPPSHARYRCPCTLN